MASVMSNSIQNIREGQLLEIHICVHSLPKQKVIADYPDISCAEIDSLLAEKEALIVDLLAYKKSLIYECVTGKRRVA